MSVVLNDKPRQSTLKWRWPLSSLISIEPMSDASQSIKVISLPSGVTPIRPIPNNSIIIGSGQYAMEIVSIFLKCTPKYIVST